MPSEKPFPWKCPTCYKDEVYMSVVPEYHLEISHKGRLVPVTVTNLETPACKSCGELLFTCSSDDQINKVFDELISAQKPSKLTKLFRWIFKYCMDCGVKLPKSYNRGDVCKKCFDDFNGATIDEIMS